VLDALACLAMAVYFEARSESFEGKIAVANVVLERMHSEQFPNTVCDVVFQGEHNDNGQPILNRCQFSFYCDGMKEDINNVTAYADAIDIAEKALAGIVYGPTVGATHYHTTGVSPYWASDLTPLGQAGNHLFYIELR